jgi:type III secretory pathway lipoprotein EscJ
MVGRATRLLALAAIASVSFAASCTVPVATEIDGAQADRVVSLLQQKGVSAEKESSDGSQRFRVVVARADSAAALSALVDQRLLGTDSDDDTPGQDTLVQSRDAEQLSLAKSIAQRVEQTLLTAGEILTARVHIALPRRSPSTENQPARASVLVRYRGAASPISAAQIQEIVAGAVPELASEQIHVVLLPATQPLRDAAPALVRFGPISVTQSSASTARLFTIGLLLLNLLLLVALIWIWSRFRSLYSQKDLRAQEHHPESRVL